MNREKVIKAINICLGHGVCNDCPYYASGLCLDRLMTDALVMLKEQEQHCCCLCGNYDTVDNFCNYHKHDVDVSEYCSRWIPR